MTTIEMKTADLRGLSLAMDAGNPRTRLRGMHLLRKHGSDMVTWTATDGKRLHSLRTDCKVGEKLDVIIPAHLVNAFLKIHKMPRGSTRDYVDVSIESAAGIDVIKRHRITLSGHTGGERISLSALDLDEIYPPVDRVIPAEILDTRGTPEGRTLNPSHATDAVIFCAGEKFKTILPMVWQTNSSPVIIGHNLGDLAAARYYIAGYVGRIAVVVTERA